MAKIFALVLAAGRGTRMGSDVPKQFLPLCGKPLFLYSVEAYRKVTDQVIVVTGKEDTAAVEEMLSAYGMTDVKVVPGGKERYESSYAGLAAIKAGEPESQNLETSGSSVFGEDEDIVLIHDGARPCITEDVIRAVAADAEKYGAAVSAVKSKDTVKVADPEGFVKETPDRNTLFMIGTPQGFRLGLIRQAFGCFFAALGADPGLLSRCPVTDDATLVEMFTETPVKLSAGSYENIKVTTKEDLPRAEEILHAWKK